MFLPYARTALVSVLLVAGCRGPTVEGEVSNGGDGSSSGSGSGSIRDPDAGSAAGASNGGGASTGAGTTGGTSSGTSTGGGDDTSGSNSGGTSSGSGSGAGASETNGGQSAQAGSDGSGGMSGTAGATSTAGGGAAPVSGCDTCEPELRVPGEGAIHYAKCAAMSDGVVYESVLEVAGGLSADVFVRAVTVESGDVVTLSGADEAISILSGDSPILGIDDTFAYWFSRTRDDGDVMRLRRRALGGGGDVENVVGVDTTLGELGGKPRAMATTTGYVYWSSGNEGVFRCPTTATCDAPELVVEGSEELTAPLPDVLGLDLEGDTLYWANTTTGEVLSRAASGTETLLDTALEPIVQICDVSFDSGSLFWILCFGTYEVRRVDPSGPTSVSLATTADTLDETAGGDLLVAGDDVYFISSDYLYQVPRDASAPAERRALIYRQGEPGIHTVVGADAEDVFLVDEEGAILSVPR